MVKISKETGRGRLSLAEAGSAVDAWLPLLAVVFAVVGTGRVGRLVELVLGAVVVGLVVVAVEMVTVPAGENSGKKTWQRSELARGQAVTRLSQMVPV